MQRTPKHTKKKPQKNRLSPFLVDLVAENERIHEEHEIRARKQKAIHKREETRDEQLLQAAGRGNDQELKNLRIEKRKIIDEEKRLKALLEIEKSNAQERRIDKRQCLPKSEGMTPKLRREERRICSVLPTKRL